ncbi:type IV conjugative transfer system coupling protein TraD [Rahnella sp. AA]|uniref:type IV conjugative transfer system coupling protein TraD n=1 Tax=Rahnella sp. AA TaxID=2057180 RepID=UPI000C3405DF|nr:type IV conjugative transfer system coupling protein TraD [Rahnella sp. AA]PKE27588.1 type IV conjugative transfer system coupling protein TraD [Rahnella sp. AA]
MSFTPKYLTQGGQMTAYRLRMFAQVNQWIFNWVLLLFVLSTAGVFWAVTAADVLNNGYWYWVGRFFSGFVPLMNPKSPATWDISWHCNPGPALCTTKLTLAQLLADPWMQSMGGQLINNLKLSAAGCGTVCLLLFSVIAWYIGRIGKKESEDTYISGMTLTDDVASVNRQLKKAGQMSDLQIGGLHMVRNAEVMNYLIHGTIGVGKSTLIRWLLDFIRKRGDRAIVYDSGGTFIETHYDERIDKILNAHDKRCENWVLWREAQQVVDYENLTASLIPVEGESDPFWVSSSRTIFSDTAMQFASHSDRSIEKFLTALLSIDLKTLREFLKNTPSANLVEEKIEKTAISIRSVVTNYAKALRYLQGLDHEGKPEFSIREWMTDAQYDKSWLFISTTARHRKSVRPLLSMWLSMATIYLQSMGEDPDRRVWFVIDEVTSLQKIPEFAETLAEGRKFGGCFSLGIQNMPQLINVYGRELGKSIFDLTNTRFYGRSPSAEVAKMVEDELGHQRRREAREQNSYGLDQIRDGISISRDKVNEPVVDYDQIMSMPNLRFYARLPGEYPVVKMDLKYRKQKKYHKALVERDFNDVLSPKLERIISQNEQATRTAGIAFPTGDEMREGQPATAEPENVTQPPQPPTVTPKVSPAPPTPVQESVATVVSPPQPTVEKPKAPATPPVAPPVAEAPVRADSAVAPEPASNVRPFTPRLKPAAGKTPAAEPVSIKPDEPAPATPRAAPAQTSPVPQQPLVAAKIPPVEVKPAVPVARLSALEMLAQKSRKPVPAADGAEDPAAAEAQGEAPDLQMDVEENEKGELVLRTLGARKDTPESLDDALADEYGAANRAMAEEEQNILRHRDDYDAYQHMDEHHEPGGFER